MLIEWAAKCWQKFSELKLTRKNRALPLSSVTLSMKIHNETITVDPMLLFQRISICKKSDEDLVEFLKYELAPFPFPFGLVQRKWNEKDSEVRSLHVV